MRTRSRSTVLLLVLLAACVLATACESARKRALDKAASNTAAAVCAANGSTVSVPQGFPSGFPLPAGTVVVSAEDRGAAGIVLTAVNGHAFADVLRALQSDLPAHGYTLRNGESETHDAESDWTSTDYDGRWAIRSSTTCSGETTLSVVARRKA